MTAEEAREPSSRDDNPYEPPATAVFGPRQRPKVLPWVLALAGLGAACGAAVELLGWARLTPAAGAAGIGGAIVGGLVGALMGRMIGRLRVAQHAFQTAAQRRDELYDELQQRRGSRKAEQRDQE